MEDIPTEEDLWMCLKVMAEGKAVGEDEIPVEVYKASVTT